MRFLCTFIALCAVFAMAAAGPKPIFNPYRPSYYPGNYGNYDPYGYPGYGGGYYPYGGYNPPYPFFGPGPIIT